MEMAGNANLSETSRVILWMFLETAHLIGDILQFTTS